MNAYTHKVQYYETDMMGITHHANYIHWMEEARIDFMDQLGFPYAKMESDGFFLLCARYPACISIHVPSETQSVFLSGRKASPARC